MNKLLILMFGLILVSLTCVSATRISYYTFESGTGTTLVDQEGRYNGTLINSPLWVNGYSGNGTYFDGMNDYINFTSTFPELKSTNNLTVEAWVYFNGSVLREQESIVGVASGEPNRVFQLLAENGKAKFLVFKQDNSVVSVTSSSNISTQQWVHLAGTLNSTGISIYVNGYFNNSAAFSGLTEDGAVTETMKIGSISEGSAQYLNATVDEIQIYNETRTSSEILRDYLGSGSVITTLTYPEINSRISNQNVSFNATYSIASIELINHTTYVWDSNGLFYSLSESITGTTNTSSVNVNNFVVGKYQWNELVCFENDTGDFCEFGLANYTFENSYTINSQEFINQSYAGNYENFVLNITTIPGTILSTAYLVYDSIRYLGTVTTSGDIFYINRGIYVPQTGGSKTFYWNLLFSNGFETNTSSQSQEVFGLGLDDCSTYSELLFNYTLKDEEDKFIMNGTTYNTSIEVDFNLYEFGTNNIVTNYSHWYNATNPALICINRTILNSSLYSVDSVARYTATNYEKEFYYTQNYSITNNSIPQNIELFALLSSDSTNFLITYKDNTFLPVEDALIKITRKYIADGQFRTVEAPKTDTSGQTIAHLDTDGVIYTLIVTKYGKILATFDNVAIKCEDALIGNCKINLNELSTTIGFDEWNNLENISYTMSFDKTAREIELIYSVTDGGTATVSINTTKFDRFGNQSICSNGLTSSAGTLLCNVPSSFGNVSVITEVYRDGSIIATNYYSISPDASEIFGTTRIIILLIMVVTLPLMMITSTIGIVVGVILGLIMGSLLFLIDGGSFLSAASGILWIIIAGVIIIWKISQNRSTI